MLTRLTEGPETPERDVCGEAVARLDEFMCIPHMGRKMVFRWDACTYTIGYDAAGKMLMGTLTDGMFRYDADAIRGMRVSDDGGVTTLHLSRYWDRFTGLADLTIPLNIASVTEIGEDGTVEVIKEGASAGAGTH